MSLSAQDKFDVAIGICLVDAFLLFPIVAGLIVLVGVPILVFVGVGFLHGLSLAVAFGLGNQAEVDQDRADHE